MHALHVSHEADLRLPLTSNSSLFKQKPDIWSCKNLNAISFYCVPSKSILSYGAAEGNCGD